MAGSTFTQAGTTIEVELAPSGWTYVTAQRNVAVRRVDAIFVLSTLRHSLDRLIRSSSRSRNYKALSSDESSASVASTTIIRRSSPSSSIDRNQCGRGQCIRSGYKTCCGLTILPPRRQASYAGTRLLVLLVISRFCRAMA